MIAFFKEYPDVDQFLPQAVAKLEERNKRGGKVPQAVAQLVQKEILQQPVAKIPWGEG